MHFTHTFSPIFISLCLQRSLKFNEREPIPARNCLYLIAAMGLLYLNSYKGRRFHFSHGADPPWRQCSAHLMNFLKKTLYKIHKCYVTYIAGIKCHGIRCHHIHDCSNTYSANICNHTLDQSTHLVSRWVVVALLQIKNRRKWPFFTEPHLNLRCIHRYMESTGNLHINPGGIIQEEQSCPMKQCINR